MLKKTEIKISIFFIVYLLILLLVYFVYLNFGCNSPIGYFVICSFGIFIFFCGVAIGEWLENTYGNKLT